MPPAAAATEPLLLSNGQEEKGWRRGQHLIDSLAYVDPLSPQEKARVTALVEEEVRATAPLLCF